MIKNCILHIGMNKTGSSAIQEYLQNNDLGSNFYYVKLGSSNHSSYITSLFSKYPLRKHDYIKRNLNLDDIAVINTNINTILIREINKKAADNYIISGEEMINLSKNELKDLKLFLSKYFSNITIVGYVREPVSFIESLYQQCLKGGLINNFNIKALYPNYKQIFEKFYKVFGDSNVHLWQYDLSRFQKKSVVIDFCNRIGIPYKKNEMKKVNKSLSLEATSLLYVNRNFFSYGKGSEVIQKNINMINQLQKIGSGKFELSPSVTMPILKVHKEDIAWIENKLMEPFIMKKSFSKNAIVSEKDMYLNAKSSIQKLIKALHINISSYKQIDDLYVIAKIIEELKLNKKELCIVHIGMPKTGSSALQTSLFTNILDDKVSYANLPVSNHSAIMFSLFATHPESHGLHQGMKHTQKQIKEFNAKNKVLLVKGFKKHDTEIEIISGEDIFHIDKNGLYRMKDFLQNYFKRIQIVGYVRPPKSFMESAFQQLVKNHSLDSFNFSLIYPQYREKLEKFDEVFGEKNVHLWKFDPKNFPNSDITLDFCKRLNIKTDNTLAVRENDAISKEAISLLFANHKYGEKFDFANSSLKVNNELIKIISQINGSKFKFSQELIAKILEKYKDDFEWIEKRMGISLKEEISESDDDIGSEEMLLNISKKTIDDLESLIETKYLPKESLGDAPKDVAKLVDALKIQVADKLGIKYEDGRPEKKEISSMQKEKEYKLLKSFDIDWSNYHEINEINDTTIDPISHYIENWYLRDIIVGGVFRTSFYLNKYPDIKKAKINPLVHYFSHGKKEKREGIEKI